MEGKMAIQAVADVSDSNSNSNSNSNNLLQANKRQKVDHAGASSEANKRQKKEISPSSPRYKGVVLQQNGHWGAQIYANHQRIWLGTFKSQEEAARAYDSAALNLRSDSQRNFVTPKNLTAQETVFQDMHTTEEVLNMIKDGSYPSKFMDFLRNESQNIDSKAENNQGMSSAVDGGFKYNQLFQKELTPSDVGKLNRLVIPKKYATKHFPQVLNGDDAEKDQNQRGTIPEENLGFYDRQMKLWKFRYCYWNSSQSFVFTRGWNKFVKEKQLKAKDIITFYKCEKTNRFNEKQEFPLIDVEYNPSEDNNVVEGLNLYPPQEDVELQLGPSSTSSDTDSKESEEGDGGKALKLLQPLVDGKKGFRLFGVHINSS